MSLSLRRVVSSALLALCVAVFAAPAAALDVQEGIGFVAITGQVEGTVLVL